ncbi:helix-turn-helix transcriptional regulator [Schaalia suimastitidis]|uniref:helix-turn-helix transcriptional regulator n=1 Tax=Schaalia suimastitidis TaxID=121163 RepID=UPI000416EF38|nr:WYL domain-containing protein [Schaalia suimastitidis]
MPEYVGSAVVRLLSMVTWLGAHQGARVDALAQQFGRTQRQIRRDIEYLASVGDSLPGASFEIDWERYYADDALYIRSTMGLELPPQFTSDQALAIIVGLTAISEALDPTLRDRIIRIALAIYPHDTAQTLTVSSHAGVRHLPTLREAIEGAHRIAMTYRDVKGRHSHRHIDPWTLSPRGRMWYLTGWCHTANAQRSFAVDRIDSVELLPEAIDHTVQAHGEVAQQDDTRQLLVTLKKGAQWIVDDYRLEVHSETAQTMTVSIPVWDQEWVDALLIDISAHIIDIPPDVRDRIREKADQALDVWTSIGGHEYP